RIVVVFPAPLIPRIPVMFPFGISREICRTAGTFRSSFFPEKCFFSFIRYVFDKCSALIIASPPLLPENALQQRPFLFPVPDISGRHVACGKQEHLPDELLIFQNALPCGYHVSK